MKEVFGILFSFSLLFGIANSVNHPQKVMDTLQKFVIDPSEGINLHEPQLIP